MLDKDAGLHNMQCNLHQNDSQESRIISLLGALNGGMAWVILPENSVSRVCISLNILRTSDFFTAECDEVLLYGQAAIEVRNHDGHTTSCGGQYIEFTLLAQLSDVPKQTPLAIVAGFDGNKRLSFVTEGFVVFWVMLQAQIVWCSLEFLSDNFTVALFLFMFSSSDKLGNHQISVISL